MANILLVAPWGPAALTFARSARRHGFAVYLLQATAQLRSSWALSAVEGSTTLPADLIGTREGLERIKQYARDVAASALVAVVDEELIWIAEHRTEFEPWCRVLIQPSQSLSRLMSKRYQLELAGNAGLLVPPTYAVMTRDDAYRIPADQFPIVLRPDRQDDVRPAFKARMMKSAAALEAFIGQCHRLNGPLIAQPFFHLPNLLVHGVRSMAGDVIASRCFLVPRKFECVSLVVEPRSFPDGLEESCATFARRAGIEGCYHFEFLYSASENRAYFLEVNVRMGGTTDKVARAGFDEPALLLASYGLIPSHGGTGAARKAQRVVNRRTLLKHIVSAARGTLTELDYPNVSRAAHIACSCRDLIVASDSTFDWHDLIGSAKFLVRGVTP